MAITAAQIREAVEEHLKLESALKDYALAREEAFTRYQHLLQEHPPKDGRYDLHAAAPLISAYEEAYKYEQEEAQARLRLNELDQKLKHYLKALDGRPLFVHFPFDELDHPAGDHTLTVENDELLIKHTPVP
ncbi:hypothetical protein V9K67_19180 [Paraflavisolibacter sp. H34]|uniref:hypothetical protein n=1 Tax=Huijunlia imazamoxiresistens TaxID=3127457 RepID=UPI00301974A7